MPQVFSLLEADAIVFINTSVPDYEIDSLARALLPAIQSLFETEEGQREFEEWKAERQKRQLNTKLNKKESC